MNNLSEGETSKLRDTFAAHAAGGLASNTGAGTVFIALRAYEIADALMQQRNEPAERWARSGERAKEA